MIRGLIAVALVFGGMVKETKCEPSTLQATLQNGYYLGSGEGQYKNPKNYKQQEHILSEEEIKIVQDVFSPDYYEPNIILDYRYMKSGGRGYTRSDGGQILILPKRKHMPNLYNDYDTLLEYLRLKHQQEINKYWRYESETDKKGVYKEAEPDSYQYDVHE